MSTVTKKLVTRRLILLIARATILMLICLANVTPALAKASDTVTFESLGCTNPGNASVLVTATPGSTAFAQAVGESLAKGKIVFVFAEADVLVAALPELERTMGIESPAGSARRGQVVTAYGYTMNGTPILCSMEFPLFRGSQEELLASRDFEETLADFDTRYVRNPKFTSDIGTLSGVTTGMHAAGFQSLTPIAKYYTYQPYGKVNTTLFCKFVTGETDPTKDWYVVESDIYMNPGILCWPSTSSWQSDFHRPKFTPYCWDGPAGAPVYSPRTVIQAGNRDTSSGQ